MAVASRSVQGRRRLAFASFDDILADAEQLVASPHTKTLGNWPLDRLLMHLATAMERSIDGIRFAVPWYIRVVGFFIKGRVLNRAMPAGFRLPSDTEPKAYPAAVSPEAALARLRNSVARTQREKMNSRHPVFGALTHEEWTRFHLRHAELHLSFAVPAEHS
jgi:hypothetical protein